MQCTLGQQGESRPSARSRTIQLIRTQCARRCSQRGKLALAPESGSLGTASERLLPSGSTVERAWTTVSPRAQLYGDLVGYAPAHTRATLQYSRGLATLDR